MLKGLDPLLTGDLLALLDRMGHSDGVVVADANFPADRIGTQVIDLPGISSPDAMSAVLSVLPLDPDCPVMLMDSGDPNGPLPVQRELIDAAGSDVEVGFLGRQEFYREAAGACLIVRCGELRAWGNALLRKGVVTGVRHD